jgi:hypothetical protein
VFYLRNFWEALDEILCPAVGISTNRLLRSRYVFTLSVIAVEPQVTNEGVGPFAWLQCRHQRVHPVSICSDRHASSILIHACIANLFLGCFSFVGVLLGTLAIHALQILTVKILQQAKQWLHRIRSPSAYRLGRHSYHGRRHSHSWLMSPSRITLHGPRHGVGSIRVYHHYGYNGGERIMPCILPRARRQGGGVDKPEGGYWEASLPNTLRSNG